MEGGCESLSRAYDSLKNSKNNILKASRFIFAFALSVSLVYNAQSQFIVKGLVIDASSMKVIPYVNIGIIELQKGTVSNGEGVFELSYSNITDSVTFSSISYFQKRTSVQSILTQKNIILQPQTYDLDEIVVSANGYGKSKIFGNKQDNKGQSIGFGSGELGSEIGAQIDIKKETWIESAHFIVNFIGPDSMKFRLNLYSMDGNTIGENLIKENIIISKKQERGTFSIDLSENDIVVNSDVLLSLEWVDRGEAETNNGMMFRAKKVRKRNANTYLKYTSLSPFRKVEAIKYELGFYLIGREIK